MKIKEEFREDFAKLADEYQGKRITDRHVQQVADTDTIKAAMLFLLPVFRQDNFKCSKCGKWQPKNQAAMGVSQDTNDDKTGKLLSRRYKSRICSACLTGGKPVDEWAKDLISAYKRRHI